MPGMFLNVFFSYLWNSLDHGLENGFNFLWGIIIIEKVTGINSITNVFVLARLRHRESLWFSYLILVFMLCCMKEEKKGLAWRGSESGANFFVVVPAILIFAFPEPCHTSGKVRVHYGFIFKMNQSFHTFRKHIQVTFKVPFSYKQ